MRKVFSIEFALNGPLLKRDLTKDDIAIILRNAAKALDFAENGPVTDWRTGRLIGSWAVITSDEPAEGSDLDGASWEDGCREWNRNTERWQP